MAKQLPPSSNSASYFPENIKHHQPTDQASRWSSVSNDQNQFLILKLDQLALLESISFGKFHKVHVCNLKEFKVYAGPTLDNLNLILHTGLSNDTTPESFPPDYTLSPSNSNLPFPVMFLKIVPLAAWGSNFNFSIWYIELRGWVDNDTVDDVNGGLVQAALEEYTQANDIETTRLILKFLRQHGHQEAYQSLQNRTGIQLEAPLVTQLHQLITQNHLKEAENLLLNIYTTNPEIFDQYLHENVPYQAHWTQLDENFNNIQSTDNNANTVSPDLLDENGDYRMLMMTDSHQSKEQSHIQIPSQPSARGGHQMLYNPLTCLIYLLGGWDGTKDLADFWSFSPETLKWTLISMDVERDNGPSARSCHKAVLHVSGAHIYVLGRYIDPERRNPLNLPCDFYRFSIQTSTWSQLSADVRAEGGPGCIYDHQMVVDEDEECIWVFGGRLLSSPLNTSTDNSASSSVYSGLYKYEINTAKWTLIHADATDSQISSTLPPIRIPSRIGHSMLFDPQTRSLLILAGQRYKDQLADFYRYAVDRQCVTHLNKNLQMVGGPEAGFTQRAVIDVESREIFVFSSLIRSVGGNSNNSSSNLNSNLQSTSGMNNPSDITQSNPPLPLNSSSSSITSNVTSKDCFFWCFDMKTEKWTKIQTAPNSPKPPTRFAHQLVYQPTTRSHFLFGGNPGNPSNPSARLNDFWRVQVSKSIGSRDVLRKCQYLIRRLVFESKLVHLDSDISSALSYLQTDLASVVNHSDPFESESFRSLSTKLFLPSPSPLLHQKNLQNLFNQLVHFLPKDMQPPTSSL